MDESEQKSKTWLSIVPTSIFPAKYKAKGGTDFIDFLFYNFIHTVFKYVFNSNAPRNILTNDLRK